MIVLIHGGILADFNACFWERKFRTECRMSEELLKVKCYQWRIQKGDNTIINDTTYENNEIITSNTQLATKRPPGHLTECPYW